MMRRRLALILTIATVALLLVPASSAFTQVTVAARESPECPPSSQRIYCLTVTDGQLEGVTQGEAVRLTLVNQGQADHNAYIALGADADEMTRDTPADAAFANTSTIASGQQTNASFVVPDDAESLYLWCEIGTHEPLGMWLEVTVEAAEGAGNGTSDDGADGNGTGDGDGREESPEEPEGVPVPAWAPLVALIGAVAVARARRT